MNCSEKRFRDFTAEAPRPQSKEFSIKDTLNPVNFAALPLCALDASIRPVNYFSAAFTNE